MEMRCSHHVDASEQAPDGSYEFYYEYDLYEFDFGRRVVRARRYVQDGADAISVLGVLDPASPENFFFYGAPEASEVIDKLREIGFNTIRVLDRDGYAPLDASRLKDDQ